MINFRALSKDDIECRVQSCGATATGAWARVLLYKDARVDMNILDKTVGKENWQNKFYEVVGNLYCSLGININYNQPDKEPYWVWKDDCGSESNTEKEKGQASDARKRSGVVWGIGRELYTKIPISIFGLPYKEKKGKVTIDGTFTVEKIEIDKQANEITALSLLFDGVRCFVWTKEKGVLQAKIK